MLVSPACRHHTTGFPTTAATLSSIPYPEVKPPRTHQFCAIAGVASSAFPPTTPARPTGRNLPTQEMPDADCRTRETPDVGFVPVLKAAQGPCLPPSLLHAGSLAGPKKAMQPPSLKERSPSHSTEELSGIAARGCDDSNGGGEAERPEAFGTIRSRSWGIHSPSSMGCIESEAYESDQEGAYRNLALERGGGCYSHCEISPTDVVGPAFRDRGV